MPCMIWSRLQNPMQARPVVFYRCTQSLSSTLPNVIPRRIVFAHTLATESREVHNIHTQRRSLGDGQYKLVRVGSPGVTCCELYPYVLCSAGDPPLPFFVQHGVGTLADLAIGAVCGTARNCHLYPKTLCCCFVTSCVGRWG